MNPFGTPSDKHRECWDLLPWLANERLTANDTRRIEAHLRQCNSCQAELAAQRRLRDAVRGSAEPVVLAPQASLQKLMARIDEEEPAGAGIPRPARVPRRAPRTRWLAIAAGIQAFAIAALLGTVWWQSHEWMTAPRFSTLTTPSSVPEGPVIRIVFREHITIAELNELLRSLDAHIVSGPSTAGVYTVQLTKARRTNEHTEEVAAQLRNDPRVSFSEPAIAELAGK